MNVNHITETEWDAALDAFELNRGEGITRLLRAGDPEVAYERSEFLREQPWRIFAAQVEQRVARERTSLILRWTIGFAGLGFILSTAVALFVFAGPSTYVPTSDIRMKGVGSIPIGIETRGELRLLINGEAIESGASIDAGSEIQFAVDTVGYDHVFVFGEEVNGTLTPYYPDEVGGSSILVGIGRGLMLPDSVQLDDSLGRECMVAVFSRTPLSWVDVQALRHDRRGARDGMLMEQVCFEKQQ